MIGEQNQRLNWSDFFMSMYASLQILIAVWNNQEEFLEHPKAKPFFTEDWPRDFGEIYA